MQGGIDLGDAIGLGDPALDEVNEAVVEVEHAIDAELAGPLAEHGVGIVDLPLEDLTLSVDALDELEGDRAGDPVLGDLGHPLLPQGVQVSELLALGVEGALEGTLLVGALSDAVPDPGLEVIGQEQAEVVEDVLLDHVGRDRPGWSRCPCCGPGLGSSRGGRRVGRWRRRAGRIRRRRRGGGA